MSDQIFYMNSALKINTLFRAIGELRAAIYPTAYNSIIVSSNRYRINWLQHSPKQIPRIRPKRGFPSLSRPKEKRRCEDASRRRQIPPKKLYSLVKIKVDGANREDCLVGRVARLSDSEGNIAVLDHVLNLSSHCMG